MPKYKFKCWEGSCEQLVQTLTETLAKMFEGTVGTFYVYPSRLLKNAGIHWMCKDVAKRVLDLLYQNGVIKYSEELKMFYGTARDASMVRVFKDVITKQICAT